MASYNRTILVGNLTRDPEIKYTPKGTAVAEIGLAVNHSYKTDSGEKREEVTFIDVTLWGRTAEIVGQYCKKGRPLLVEGRLALDQWDDKQTGQKRSKLKVVGENVQLLGGKDDAPTHGERASGRTAARPTAPPPRQQDPDLDADPQDPPF
jgi:single-strand DNA-binding protein